MTETPKTQIIWQGRPWVAPQLVIRTILIAGIAAVVIWAEFFFAFAGIQIVFLTGLIFFVIWIISISGLLLSRASNFYILRKEGLEVRTGIITTKVFVLMPVGFSDLEVTRTVTQRIVGTGNITLRTESERGVELRQIRDPKNVTKLLRETLSKQVFKLDK
jgi:membrane protein YdbS with pleckstrin-like domain